MVKKILHVNIFIFFVIILFHVALYLDIDIDGYILLFERGCYDMPYLLYVRVFNNKIDQAKDAGRWLAGAVMERKCLKDIITRSADIGEGPHFKQVET